MVTWIRSNQVDPMLSPLLQMTQTEAAAGCFGVAFLPLGAMEPHGPHLPLGVDALIAEGLLTRAAELDRSTRRRPVLPTLWLGASCEHGGRAGLMTRPAEAVAADIVAVGRGAKAMGIDRLIILNAHGGNIAASTIAALRLRTECGMLAAHPHWLDFGLPAGMTPPAELSRDWHGGWVETSIMLNLAPGLVRMDLAAPTPADPERVAPMLQPFGPAPWGWMTGDLSRSGAIGRPDLATAALGAALIDHAAQSLLALADQLEAMVWSP
jgi:creatinine amidohydrolase